MGVPQNLIRVSVSEAGRLLGVHTRTIRRALSANEIQYIVVRGRYKINFESLIRWSQQKATVKRKSDNFGIGQFVERWKIRNVHYSPNPKMLTDDPKRK